MSSHRGDFLDCKVYVGGLPADATSQEVEDAFHRYGRIRKVWVARRPPGFAFVEFEDNRDAEDAVRALDGNRICGVRARVELSHGRRRNEDGGGYRGGRGGRGRGGDRGGGYGGDRGGDRRYSSQISALSSSSGSFCQSSPFSLYYLGRRRFNDRSNDATRPDCVGGVPRRKSTAGIHYLLQSLRNRVDRPTLRLK
uniref:RRM domain-containing protein n=1 Tax=Plectus sambesii TaxID=2011161 RepID=A0A914VUQ1_9BILA